MCPIGRFGVRAPGQRTDGRGQLILSVSSVCSVVNLMLKKARPTTEITESTEIGNYDLIHPPLRSAARFTAMGGRVDLEELWERASHPVR